VEVSGQIHDHGRFTPRERAPNTHWIAGWVGPRAVVDAVVKRKFPSHRIKIYRYYVAFNVMLFKPIFTKIGQLVGMEGGTLNKHGTGVQRSEAFVISLWSLHQFRHYQSVNSCTGIL
jgi:hypothetical protein